ncbi:MAG: hypothetical protein GXO78_00165 [Calditrichaeota bacterium]|nr:hypothetical protein [Calditrichota bacterium]
MKPAQTILILGGNELASATALELVQAGFAVMLYVSPDETYLRYPLCFGEALRAGQKTIGDLTASIIPEEKLAQIQGKTFAEKMIQVAQFLLLDRMLPVLSDVPLRELLAVLETVIVINTLPEETLKLPEDAANGIFLGCFPEHRGHSQYRLLVETRWNYQLGKIVPPDAEDLHKHRLDPHFFHFPFQTCHTPIEGLWVSVKEIGETIRYNEAIGKVDAIEIRSPYDGQLWGITHSGQFVAAGQNVALIYTGRPTEFYRDYSFQERAVARGFLSAVLKLIRQ